MRIVCPYCAASGELDESKRPPGSVSIRCPRCKGSIPLRSEQERGIAAHGERGAPPQLPPSGRENDSRPEPPATEICTMCGGRFSREDVIRFGPELVCAGCKPRYVQMLEQGDSRPGSFRYGGFWIRFVAKIVDGLLLGVVDLVLSYLIRLPLPGPGDPASALVAVALSTFANFALAVAVTTWFLGRFGATPGKMALGLAVVRPDGGKISYQRAFGRYFAEFLSSLILCVGYLMAAFDDEKRALHDRICDTRVIYT